MVIAQWLKPGSVVALEGDLGAGKTTFSQAFARGLGVREIVSSPTFTIIKEYDGDQYPFYHMDVYRLSADEADELGLDDYFYGDGVTLIEWASRIGELLPEDRLEITLLRADEVSSVRSDAAQDGIWDPNKRIIRVVPYGDYYVSGCKRLQEQGVWE